MRFIKFLHPLGNWLYNFNIDLFHKINNSWSNPFFDFIMPYIRESIIWVPLYAFMLVFVYLNFGKKTFIWVLASIVVVICSDWLSSGILKNHFQIPRPCRDSFLDPVSNLRINRCPTSYSFTSSHAVNHFTIAAFWVSTLKHSVSWVKWLFLWAATICYAQVYVGVHFPMDVIFGGLLGLLLGNFFGNIFNIKFALQPMQLQT